MTKLEKLQKAKAKIDEKFEKRIAKERATIAKEEAKKAAKEAKKAHKKVKVSKKEKKNTVNTSNVKSF